MSKVSRLKKAKTIKALTRGPVLWGYTETRRVDFSELKGLTLSEIVRYSDDSDILDFYTVCGRKFRMQHEQDGCESVYIESITGELNDLIGFEILRAREETATNEEASESGTWTFYKLATRKGYVDIRWNGESNGYYSESVSFFEYKPKL